MKIDQAVIFCGGYGKRLLPLTKNVPKPMLLVNNIPFLEYLINDLKKKYKINKFLLLVGYKKKIIKKYFKKKKIKIEFNYDPANVKTGERLWNSRSKLDKFFLLLYSDNLFSFNYKNAISNFLKKKKTVNLILKKKKLGNFKINKNKLNYSFRRSNRNPFVELGNMIVERNKLIPFLKKNYKSDFKKTICEIVKKNEYSFNTHEDIYCSIGDLDRYRKSNLYLQKKKFLFIDRDGFLTKKLKKFTYVKRWNDLIFIKKTINLLKALSEKGFTFIIITNQAGVSRKIVKLNDLKIINKNIKSFLKERFNITIKDIFYCIHGWNSNCNCRKPKPGMFYKASKKYNINLSDCLYIGDDPRDCIAAYNANCKSIFYGIKSKVNYLDRKYRPIAISKNVKYLLKTIINFYK